MKKIFIALSFILLTYSLVIVFLGYSSVGLKMVQKGLNTFTFGTVVIEKADGRLLADWSMEGVEVHIPGVDISLTRMEGDWRPAWLLLARLHIEKFTVRGLAFRFKDDSAEAPPEDADGGGVTLPPFILPIAVHLGQFLLEDVSVVTSIGEEYTIIDKMESRFDGWGGLLSFSDFSLQGPDYSLAFHGSVDVLKDYDLDLLGQISFKGYGFHQLHGTFSFVGPLNNPKVHLAVSEPADIIIDGKVENLLSSPKWRGLLTARDVDLSELIVSCPEIDLQAFHGDISGDTTGYRGHVEARGSYDTLHDLDLVSNIDADWMSIDFKSLQIGRDETSAVAENAKISWYSLFEWEGEFIFENIDASILDDTLEGRLSAELISKGDVKENGVLASFIISKIEGVLHAQAVSGEGNVFLDEERVYTDGFTIKSGEFGGLAHIRQAELSWAKQLGWSGDVSVENFDPACLHPDFHGLVNGNFLGNGSFGKDGPDAYFQLNEISGRLLGNDLSGGGELWLNNNTFRTTGLVLKSGPSQLKIEGGADDSMDIDFLLTAPDIGLIFPESSGSLSVQGSLSGERGEPELDLVLRGNNLSYQENSLVSITVDLQTVLKDDWNINGLTTAENIRISGIDVDQGSIELSGTLTSHILSIHLANRNEKLSLKGQGSYKENWQGELESLNLDSRFLGQWSQDGVTQILLSKTGAEAASFCLVEGGDKDGGKICLDGKVLMDDLVQWSMAGSFQSVSLQAFDFEEMLSVPLVGTVDGSVSVKGDTLRISEAKADIKIRGAYFDVKNYFEEKSRITFTETVLSMELSDNELQGVFSSRMDNGSELSLGARVRGVGEFSATPDQIELDGLLKLDDFDLVLLDSFTSYSVEPTGKLFSTIKLSGTVADPKASGDMYLERGGVDLPLQGVSLTDLTVTLKANEAGASVTARAQSGPGQLDVEGLIGYRDSAIIGDLRIRGADFELFNLPEYVIQISPDVHLLLTEDDVRLEGEVDIPYAMITPEAMRGAISVSEDVVFTDGGNENKDEGWPISSSMKVVLGDDVSIDGYGLKGKLTGGINVEMVPNEMLTGKGELALVGGTFNIYGRLLDINRGRVLFTGGPINNPGLDVRAQKEVKESQTMGSGYTVGVDISGLLQDLKFDLVSDPYMDDADILSQMIVGGSFGSSSESENNLVASAAAALGIRGGSFIMQSLGSVLSVDDLHLEGSGREEDISLVVGKRLGTRLFVGYDMNMFSQLGQFRVRYDLTHGFAVETTSSTESTGADLLYSFEK